MKIYIIGPSGSGKSTLSKKLSGKYNIENYELDLLVFDDEHDHVKRSDKDILKLFNKVISKDNWIIEDTGRSIFEDGLKKCDKIYYINIPKTVVYFRVIKRWCKQRIGIENYNYPPTLFQFVDMIKTTHSYYKKEKIKINRINKYLKKVKYLNYYQLNSFYK